jgi:hypothetical protein
MLHKTNEDSVYRYCNKCITEYQCNNRYHERRPAAFEARGGLELEPMIGQAVVYSRAYLFYTNHHLSFTISQLLLSTAPHLTLLQGLTRDTT